MCVFFKTIDFSKQQQKYLPAKNSVKWFSFSVRKKNALCSLLTHLPLGCLHNNDVRNFD